MHSYATNKQTLEHVVVYLRHRAQTATVEADRERRKAADADGRDDEYWRKQHVAASVEWCNTARRLRHWADILEQMYAEPVQKPEAPR